MKTLFLWWVIFLCLGMGCLGVVLYGVAKDSQQETQTYKVTAYCHNECCCGEWADGFFANGEPVGGLAIAAPKSIPFGTVLFIPGYGTATVKDRGGSMQGNRLDVYFPTHQEALDWGVQYLTITRAK